MTTELWMWTLFCVFVVGALAVDLGIFNKKSHTPSFKESVGWVSVWVTLALLFCLGLWLTKGDTAAIEFLTGYLIEQSLSVDNLFVFLMLFTYFKVPKEYQHKILFWGIVGAVIMRAIFIYVGLTVLHHFEWMMYILGLFLIYVGAKMFFKTDEEEANPNNFILKALKRIINITPDYKGDKFLVKENGKLVGTPLLVVLVAVETTDVIFAADSIPAVLAVTRDPFIVFTSNIFAILGLRSLFFVLSGVLTYFRFLHYGVSFILVLVGVKMIAAMQGYKVAPWMTLTAMALIISASVTMSLVIAEKEEVEHHKK